MKDKKDSLPVGWYAATDDESKLFEKELRIELIHEHPLFHTPIRVIAHTGGRNNDILCKLVNEKDGYAVVHLTWLMKPEIDVTFPFIEYRGTFQGFVDYAAEDADNA